MRVRLDPNIEGSMSYVEVMAIILVVLGSVLLIIGFLGCCGAMKQVKIFLTCVRTSRVRRECESVSLI